MKLKFHNLIVFYVFLSLLLMTCILTFFSMVYIPLHASEQERGLTSIDIHQLSVVYTTASANHNITKPWWQQLTDFITASWNQTTVAWIIISGIVGSIITEVFKFVFEQNIPQWQRRRARRIAIQKYSYPIIQSGYILLGTIQEILQNPNITNDQNRCLNILYDFGCFLGWIKILSNEAFLEGVEGLNNLKKFRGRARFESNFYQFLYDISSDSYYQYSRDYSRDDVYLKTIRSLIIPRSVLNVIGELMINSSNADTSSSNADTSSSNANVINVVNFIKNYDESDDFKKWFIYIESLFSEIQRSRFNSKWNVLIRFQVHLVLFVTNLSRKEEAIPQGWIPPIFKLIFSKVAWLPTKIMKYLRLLKYFINLYMNNRSVFKLELDRFTKKGEFEFLRKKSGNELLTNNIVIQNDNHMKYNGKYVFKEFPDALKYYMEYGNNGFIKYNTELFLRYIHHKNLHPEVLQEIMGKLKRESYIDIINRFYHKQLSYFHDLTIKDFDNAKSWNDKGLLYAMLENYNEAIPCYKQAISLSPKYRESWNDKGLAHIEMKDYDSALECFEKALEITSDNDYQRSKEDAVDLFYNSADLIPVYYFDYKLTTDIWNNLGVSHYELGHYEKALQCFEKALEENDKFKPAFDNKLIVLQKLKGKKEKEKSSVSTSGIE